MPGMNRLLLVAASVVIFHLAALWALQSGLLRRVVQIVVPVQVLSEVITPPAPRPAALEPAPLPPPKAPPPPRVAKPQPPKPAPTPSPLPLAVADTAPASVAPVPVAVIAVPAPAAAPPAPAAPAAVAAPPAPPRLQMPSSAADYLNNPSPEYPRLSRRMGEQGKVVLRVFIDVEGKPQTIEIRQSSGFDRLDQQAIESVKRWRFVPGKRNGVPEAMWNIVPINFVLE